MPHAQHNLEILYTTPTLNHQKHRHVTYS